jgi:hypothetical protein
MLSAADRRRVANGKPEGGGALDQAEIDARTKMNPRSDNRLYRPEGGKRIAVVGRAAWSESL